MADMASNTCRAADVAALFASCLAEIRNCSACRIEHSGLAIFMPGCVGEGMYAEERDGR